MLPPARARFLAVLYAAALAYLSLIPLQFRPLPLGEAWHRFAAIPFLPLGLLDRADWVANLVAYVPLGLLLAASLGARGRRFSVAGFAAAVTIAALFAVTIEFAQLFFAPRTVSLNDLLAQLLGAAAGASLWPAVRGRFEAWARALVAGGTRSVRALLWAYSIAYLLLSLFPYDFVVSVDELVWKLGSDAYGLLFARGQCTAFLGCSLKLGAEVLAVAPLGWLLASYNSTRILGGAVFGAALGLLLEGAQFLLVSGQSQGVSVIARALGVALGVALQQRLPAIGVDAAIRWGRAVSIAGIPPYLLLLAYASGWMGATPVALGTALQRLPHFNYLPFYYHYYVPEVHAVASAVAHIALYAPVGIGVWVWLRRQSAGAALAALVACGLAFVTELSKALLPAKHPDFTDVLLAGVSAWTVFRALQLATASGSQASVGAPRVAAAGARP